MVDGKKNAFLTDVQTLRANAKKSLDDGAVTATYKGDVKTTIDILQAVVATELVCVLRYTMHAISVEGLTSLAACRTSTPRGSPHAPPPNTAMAATSWKW